MAGVDDLVVYMQTVVKYSSLYIHHPGGAKPNPVVVYIFGVPKDMRNHKRSVWGNNIAQLLHTLPFRTTAAD